MNKLKLVLTWMLTMCCLIQYAQTISTSPGYFSASALKQGVSAVSGGQILLNQVDKDRTAPQQLREKNKSAKLYLKLDLGNDYVATPVSAFRVSLSVTANVGGAIYTKNLIINQNTPEVLEIVNVSSSISTSSSITVLAAAAIIDDNDPTGTPQSLPAGLLKNYIDHNLRLTATLVREYGVDVRQMQGGSAVMSNAPIVDKNNFSITNRLVKFSWLPTAVAGYPNYEIQILKLYNTDKDLRNDENEIRTTVDWSKALRVETQSSDHFIKLTMAEGTGFYIWRVRPIGTYFNGGIANSENYGEWSYAGATGAVVSFKKDQLESASNPTPYAFYFTDPDKDINWIYSRTFTESDLKEGVATGAKVNEGMSYADGLLRARQSQEYNSSNGTTIVSQTISDYSGRAALTTLPVPVNGNLSNYKVNFVRANTGELYTAANYDDGLKTDVPDQINDATGSAFSYYSNNSTVLNGNTNNDNVPNAEGYAFQRTKFKNDGSGRVEETSGVGKTHSLGSQSDGKGRTTRVLYGTPSDDELIRIFGEEAPLAESVIKTTTIDPNNVVSVTYTSKEGKTIATALVTEETSSQLPAKRSATALIGAENIIDQNTVSGGKFISSKRITVPVDGTLITLNYDITEKPAITDCSSGNCNLNLRFYLTNTATGETYTSDANSNTVDGNQPFSIASAFSFPADWRFTKPSGTNPILIPTGTNHNIIELPAGEYKFTKEVYSSNDEATAAAAVDKKSAEFQPVLDAIAEKMAAAKTPLAYSDFTTLMATLTTKINAYQLDPSTTNSNELLGLLSIIKEPNLNASVPADFVFPLGFILDPILPTQGATADLTFSTSCCGSMKAQLPKPDICFVCEGAPNTSSASVADMITANATAIAAKAEVPYGFDDIISPTAPIDADRKTALNALVQYYFIDLLSEKMTQNGLTDLYTIAPGFTFDGLKFMIYNMLVSRYYVGNAMKKADGLWYTSIQNTTTGAWEASNTLVSTLMTSTDPQTMLPYNYKCKNLLTCWTDAVNLLGSFENEDDVNIVDAFNDQDGDNSAQNESDDDENFEEMSKRQKKKLSKSLGRELEEYSDSDDGKVPKSKIEALTSLVSNFMDCAGHQFAAIIDGSELPDYLGLTSDKKLPLEFHYTTQYPGPTRPTEITANYTVIEKMIDGVTYSGLPVLFSKDDQGAITYEFKTCDGTQEKVLTYPYMLRPEWMFKYFTYNVYGDATISDENVQVPNQVMIDISNCYNLPETYLATGSATLCQSSCDVNHLHQNWSAAERASFYTQVSGAPNCWENKGVNEPYLIALPECASKSELLAQARDQVNTAKSQCEGKARAIKSALIAELIEAHYTIVDCQRSTAPGEITDKEIDLMVAAVIEKCKATLTAIGNKLPSDDLVTSCGDVSAGYGCTLNEFPKCIQTDCSEIILTKNNSIKMITSRKIEGALFADCDLQVFDLLSGTFLPDIPLFGPGTKATKEWKNSNCTTGPCPENRSCPGTTFTNYSQVNQVEATRH